MRLLLLCGFVLVALCTLTVSKKHDRGNIQKVGIELDVVKGNARITYNNKWSSEAEVLYAKKKKIVAYKDTENEWCLLEKRTLASQEQHTRQFEIINKPLEKDQLERFGGKKVVTFCGKHTSLLLLPFLRDDRRGKTKRGERVKREMHPLQRNETHISHQEASKNLLEDLSVVQNLGSSRAYHGKGLKRNVDDKIGNSRGFYPSSSAKVGQSPGIDYHTHIRNNLFPGTHAVHPIDITSSVTITTGSSHNIWSYPPSSGGHHNDTAASHSSGTSHLSHGSHKNASHGISSHGVQHSHSLHHLQPSSSGQNQGHYPPSSVGNNHQGQGQAYPPSATSKPQQPPSYFAPSSNSKTQAPVHYQPSITTKTQEPSGYFPPSSSAKTQPPSHYHPLGGAKYQPSFGHYPPSSSGNTQGPGSYPPSSTSRSQQTPAYYPPSSSSKTQGSASYPPSSSSKTQGPASYPPSSSGKTQGPGSYPPSSTSRSQQTPAYYPPSSSSKTQGPASYPPSSSSKTQGPAGYPPSSTSGSQHPQAHYPPSSSSNNQGTASYPPSSTSRSQQTPGYYPPSSSSKTQGPASYPPSSSSKTQGPAGYPPSSTSRSQQPQAHYPPSSSGHNQDPASYPPSSSSKTQGPASYPPSSTSGSQHPQAHYPPSSSSKPQQGTTFYSSSPVTKPQYGHEHHQPSSVSISQHSLPSATDKTHHTAGLYPPSFVSKSVHDQYPPSSTAKTHHLQQNVTTGNQSPSHFVGSHLEHPTYVPPSSTSKIHHQPQNRTHFQHNTMYSYGAGMYAPQFPPSSASKPYPPQQFPSSVGNVNHVPHGENHGVHYHPNSFAQYPPSSTSKFHTKLDQSQGQTPNFPPSSTSKMDFPFNAHGSTVPVLEKPSAQGNPWEHGSYSPSSSAKEHPTVHDAFHYPPSSTSKAHYVPSGGHTYGGTHQGHGHAMDTKVPSAPPSGSSPSAQIPQPPVSGHFHSSLHMHSSATQYYPPYASAKQPHSVSHSETQQPAAYHPSSTAKLHPVPKQNITPGYYPPSSVGHRHDIHYGVLTPAYVPHYPPSAFSKSTLNQGPYSHSQHYPRYAPSASSYNTRNESSTTQGKFFSPSSVGHGFYSQSQYPPSSSSRLHPNASENTHPSSAMPSYPSGGQHYPTHSPYNATVPQYHQYEQPNNAPQHQDKPQFQQGSAKPCQGSTYSITTRTIVTPNGVIRRPVSVKNNGQSPCGHAKQGAAPHTIPCGSIIKNGHSVKVQNPCTSNHPNQRKLQRNVLVPGPAMMPVKRPTGQNEFGNNDGVVITNVGESEAEVLDGIGYPISHQKFSHLKENSTSEDLEVEDLEDGENQTKTEEAGEKEKVEDVEEESSSKREEEEEVKEGDVLEPGDRILGKNGYTISDGFRGRVVSVSGQVGKTRTTKTEKTSNSAQFKYSSELGRYSKDDGEKRYSDCNGEVTFTCSEFLGSNGRAKICKPNPRRNPDGSPC